MDDDDLRILQTPDLSPTYNLSGKSSLKYANDVPLSRYKACLLFKRPFLRTWLLK